MKKPTKKEALLLLCFTEFAFLYKVFYLERLSCCIDPAEPAFEIQQKIILTQIDANVLYPIG
jgi:hypothetical protein